MLNRQPVVFCMDRAGFVGDDGAVHHGFMDQAFLRPLPGMVLMAPSDEAELNRSLRLALSLETASALRYPRDNVPATNFEEAIDEPLASGRSQEWAVGKSRVLREGEDATIVAYGALVQNAMLAAEELSADGLSVGVIDARFCKPVDGEMLTALLSAGHPVLTVEDHSLQNGFGTAVMEYAVSHRLADRLHYPAGHARSPDRPRHPQGAACRSGPRCRRDRPQRPRRHPGSRHASGADRRLWKLSSRFELSLPSDHRLVLCGIRISHGLLATSQRDLDNLSRAEQPKRHTRKADSPADDEPRVSHAMNTLTQPARQLIVRDQRNPAGQANLPAVRVAGEVNIGLQAGYPPDLIRKVRQYQSRHASAFGRVAGHYFVRQIAPVYTRQADKLDLGVIYRQHMVRPIKQLHIGLTEILGKSVAVMVSHDAKPPMPGLKL